MKSIIKDNLKRYILDKRKIALFAMFAFFCGTETGKAVAANMSLYEYVLFIMSNHYYIVFFLLMSYAFFLFDNMREETELMRIRLKTVKRQYVCRIICILLQSIIYVLAHFLLATAIGVTRFGYSAKFTVRPVEGFYSETMAFIHEYMNYFEVPLLACIATAIYMIFGLTFIAVIIYIADSVLGRRISLVLIGVVLLDIMLGFKLGIDGMFGILFINNYFILHHVLFGSGTSYIFVNICVGIAVTAFGCRFFMWKKTNGNNVSTVSDNIFLGHMFRNVYIYSAVFVAGYIILNAVSVLRLQGNVAGSEGITSNNCVADVVFSNLSGYSNDNFYIFEFIRYVIFYFVPLFFVGMITEHQRKMFNSHVMVRYGRKKWLGLLRKNLDKYICIYSLFFIGIIGSTFIVGSVIFDYSPKTHASLYAEFMEYMGVDEKYFGVLVIGALVLKMLELLYYKYVYILVCEITHNCTISYVITFLGFIPAIMISGVFGGSNNSVLMIGKGMISYGCSSLYNIAHGVAGNGFGITICGTIIFLLIKIILINKCIDICSRRTNV